MSKDEARKKLEEHKADLQRNREKYEKAEQGLDGDATSVDIIGPGDELAYQRMKNEIKESGDE